MALKCIRAGAFCLSKIGGQLVKNPQAVQCDKTGCEYCGLPTVLRERGVHATGYVQVYLSVECLTVCKLRHAHTKY